MSFKNDYIFGKQKEDEVLNIIKKKIRGNIIKTEKRYERYDFKDGEYYYELKSRNNKYNDYPTTLIEKGKVIDDKLVFLFNFTDGLYYIVYNKELFEKFECKLFLRHKRCDYIDKPKLYYHIPIQQLTIIEAKKK